MEKFTLRIYVSIVIESFVAIIYYPIVLSPPSKTSTMSIRHYIGRGSGVSILGWCGANGIHRQSSFASMVSQRTLKLVAEW